MNMKSVIVTAGLMCAAGMVMGAGEVYPYGVCAHVTRGEGEPYFLKHTLNAMELAGIKYVRSDFDTGAIRRKDGTFDFTRYDKLIDKLEKQGITLMPIIYGLNWPHAPKTEQECADHAAFVKGIVSHYGKRCPVVEIWNEANHNFFMRGANPVDYARMLKISYDAVKSVDPSIKVAFTGTAGVPLDWIRKVMENGAAKCFDIMNVHPYAWPGQPEGRTDAEAEAVKALLAEFGREDAAIWFTEIGWPTHQIKEVPNIHILLAGLKVARPNQKAWNIILADNQSEGDVNQVMAEALADLLPVGSSVKACSQKETCAKLASGTVDAVVYPFDMSFPADTIDAVNDFIKKGGVFVDFGGIPCYYGKRDGAFVPGMQNGGALKHFPFGYRAWWLKHLGEFPRKINLNATQAGLDAGVKEDPTGFTFERFLAPDDAGKDFEWIPLIAGKSEKGVNLVGAGVIRYKGERTGAAVLCSLMTTFQKNGTATEEEQARYTARALGISFAEGIEAYFAYNLRSFEKDPYYSEEHYGLMHADFQPKPAYSAYANFTRERPAGSVQKPGAWRSADRTFYYPQWTRPDGQKAGMLWTPGKDFVRTICFTATPTFHTMNGRKIAFREVEKNVYNLKISGAPIYFSSAELAD